MTVNGGLLEKKSKVEMSFIQKTNALGQESLEPVMTMVLTRQSVGLIMRHEPKAMSAL